MENQCKFCGAALPQDAAFCPVCAKSQIEKRTVSTPLPRRKRIRTILACTFAVLVVLTAVTAWFYPRDLAGGASLTYKDSDGTYRLLLCYPGDARKRQPTEEFSVTLPEEAETFVPSMLVVYREGSSEDVSQEFLSKVQSVETESVALSGQGVTCDPPAALEDFPLGDLTSLVWLNGFSGRNEIVWTLKMKNRDTITMRHVYNQERLPERTYRYDDTPMETAAELQALADQIGRETTVDTVIYLHLPPVTYTEPVTFPGRTYYIYGEDDTAGSTVFAETLTVETEPTNAIALFHNLSFQGRSGIGVDTGIAAQFHNCIIRGWDTGILARDYGTVCVKNCLLEDNGIGIHYTSTDYIIFNGENENTVFRNNKVAVLLAAHHGTVPIEYITCTFTGNGENVRNPIRFPVDLSRAILDRQP